MQRPRGTAKAPKVQEMSCKVPEELQSTKKYQRYHAKDLEALQRCRKYCAKVPKGPQMSPEYQRYQPKVPKVIKDFTGSRSHAKY